MRTRNYEESRAKKSKKDDVKPKKNQVIGDFYKVEMLLGSGTSGEVWKSSNIRTGQKVAIKINRIKYSTDAKKEIKILTKVNAKRQDHFLVTMLDQLKISDNICIVLELMDNDFHAICRRRTKLDSNGVKIISKKIITCLHAIRNLQLLRRDIKPENILVRNAGSKEFSDWIIKIRDFGFSASGEEKSIASVGTLEYRSIEVIIGLQCSYLMDIWSAGFTKLLLKYNRR
jgi:serine/threonine-protein kinase